MQNRENAGKNKKTVLTIAIALLLVLALALGGFTFAKYISQGNGSDSARVAAWGFTVEAGGDNAAGFNTQYANDTSEVIVRANGSSKVVAPGTSGQFNFSISGTAEVAAEVTFSLAYTSDIGLPLTPSEGGEAITYNPIRFTLNKDNSPVEEDLTLAELKTALEEIRVEVKPNESYTANYTITWAWAFDGNYFHADESVDTTAENGISCDVLDTLLGQGKNYGTVEIGEDDYYTVGTPETDIAFDLTVSVGQINDLA